MLTDQQRKRFSRQLVLEGVGEEGQERLARARVLVVGTGGLGSPACFYLVAAGIGTLGIVDFDTVSLSNLNRQILHAVADIGQLKTASAAQSLAALHPDVQIVQYAERLDAERARELVAQYDLIVECSDTFDTKFLVNEACVQAQVPLVWGSVLGWQGQMSVVMAGEGPCYHCLFPPRPRLEDVPTARTVGILGAVAGTMGALQAVEAIKVLLGTGRPLVGRLLVWDGLAGCFEEISFEPQPACPVCCPTGS